MTEEIQIKRVKKISKKELFIFLGWLDHVYQGRCILPESVPLSAETTAIIEVAGFTDDGYPEVNLVITATYQK